MRVRLWLFAVLFGLGMPGAAVQAAGEAAFQQGVTAFRNGELEEAGRFFEQARDAGLDSAALYFNLGATWYRLGRYGEAREAFAVCQRDPAWTSLCSYNIGLTFWQQGDRAMAADHFSRVWRHAEDAKLAALALTMLERVDPLARWIPRSRVAVNLGYDSNVVLTDQALPASASGKSDLYTELTASTGARLGSGTVAPRWQVSLYDLRYFDLTEYSLSLLQLGMDIPWHLGNWYSAAGAEWRSLWLDGSSFQQIGTLKAFAEYGFARDHALLFNIRYDQVDSLDSRYRFLDGVRVEAGVSLTQPLARGWMSYGLTVEINDRTDLVLGGDFYSYSPHRAGLWWRGSWLFGGRWRVEPSVRYRVIEYADEDRHGGIVQTREDRDWQAGLAVRYRLTGVWQLISEYLYSGNDSNFSEFSYTRHQVMVGILRPL